MTERPRTESDLLAFLRASDLRAPEELHRKVESMIAARSPATPSGRTSARSSGVGGFGFGLRLVGVGALAAIAAVAITVALSGGSGSGLSVRQAAVLTLRPATAPAPAEGPGNRGELAAAVDGVSFPYWEEHFGWRSTGARSDRVGGRTVMTVFYEDVRGRRLGYAIVAGTPAPALSGGAVSWRSGVPYRLLTENGVQTITWLRDGHLCVVSGRGVDSATLLRLASWASRGSVA